MPRRQSHRPAAPRVAAAITASEEIPARGTETRLFHWGLASDSVLWADVSSLDTVVTVGIKRPGTARGAWQGRFLLSDVELAESRRSLLSNAAVRFVASDAHIPAVRVKIRDLETLARIRRMPFVDYVEPALVRVLLASPSGCGASDHGGMSYQTIAASTGGLDTLPHNFVDMGITRAWDYSVGAGVNIGLTDTGVWDEADSEFGAMFFASGMSTGRTFGQTSTMDSDYVSCSHGSRVAGLLAAPRNGRQIVGVAYASSLYSAQQHDDVWFATEWDIEDAQQAIHDVAYYGGARVIVMAWAASSYHHSVADELRAWYNVHDRMFVGAAGTCTIEPGCPSTNDVMFPADMEEVLAVSAANEDGSRPNSAFYGNQVDMIAYTNQETTGLRRLTLQQLGGTSGATPIVGGVAALVRARYPYMTNIQVMRRLMDTSGRRCGGNLVWRDMLVNAEAAVGGICFVDSNWHGPNEIVFSTGWPDQVQETYTVVATGGNGPLTYQWSTNPSTGPSATYTFSKLPGQDYTQAISVTIRDTGSNNPGKTSTLLVRVYDRSNCGESGENCPP